MTLLRYEIAIYLIFLVLRIMPDNPYRDEMLQLTEMLREAIAHES